MSLQYPQGNQIANAKIIHISQNDFANVIFSCVFKHGQGT